MDLVTTTWLKEQMESPDWKAKFRLLDATWDLPSSKRDFLKEHMNCRIPGAKHFALANCRNKEAKLPNTIPTPAYFQEYVSTLGVSNEHHIIIYDNSEKFGIFSAPRVWWLFNVFGHEKVSVLDGGLPKWKKDGFPTKSGEYTNDEKFPECDKFKATFNPELVVDLEFMKDNVAKKGKVQILDARPSGRFRGVEPEPRPDIPSGHIPHSISLPMTTNLDKEKKVFLPLEELKSNFQKHGVNIDNDMVCSCGSGITASVLVFIVYLLTKKRIPLFDDSWFGWQTNTPEELQIREKPLQ